mgnify:CR=1 FL=1
MREINTKDCHVKFGNFIKDARNNKALSQGEVADRLGISQSYLSKIESGERQVDLAVALMLCNILNVDIQIFTKEFI